MAMRIADARQCCLARAARAPVGGPPHADQRDQRARRVQTNPITVMASASAASAHSLSVGTGVKTTGGGGGGAALIVICQLSMPAESV
jgi:hypothetical protein